MASSNYGKKFENKFQSDWLKIINSDCIRLKDIMSGYKKIKNISDFICYIYPYVYYLDCKSLRGNTFNFAKLTQWDEMEKHAYKPGVNIGAIIWFIDHNKVCFVPIEEFIRLRDLGYKSIHVNMIEDDAFNKVYEIPSRLIRLFMDSDYSIMKDIGDLHYLEYNNG